MKKIIATPLLFLFFACANPDEKIADEYIDKDIENRLEIIKAGAEYQDTPVVSTEKITAEVNNLILLSKDVENIRASINQSNSYFKSACAYYHIENAGFNELKVGMRLAEITDNIKRNELNLLNRIIIKRSKNGPPLFTAQ